MSRQTSLVSSTSSAARITVADSLLILRFKSTLLTAARTRLDGEALYIIEMPPLLSALQSLERRQPAPPVADASAERAAGLRWVVLHRALLDDAALEARASLLRGAGAQERVRTDDVVVWEL